MLVLTRKVGEGFEVLVGGERVVVRVVQTKGRQTRLGIEAPPLAEINRLGHDGGLECGTPREKREAAAQARAREALATLGAPTPPAEARLPPLDAL